MPPNVDMRPPRSRVGSVRQSEPMGFNPWANGGIGVIPRRGVSIDLCNGLAVQRFAQGSPLRLLKLLPDLHPDVGAARNNILRLACAKGDVRIEAVRLTPDDATTDDLEQKGTDALNALWESLPRDIGGFYGLLSQLVQEATLTGLPCVEAVPGKRGQGVTEIWPVDSASVAFRRKDGQIVPLQRQVFPKTGERESYMGYTVLDPETFYWHALDAQVDDPYGSPLFGTAVAEALADLAMIKDLRDAIHNAAWPRLSFGFNWTETYKLATELYGLTDQPGDMKASQWVEDRFAEFKQLTSDLRSDDSIYHPTDATVDNLTPGVGFQSINQTLEFLRARVIQSLKALPSVMGLALGNTETYGSIQWKLYALTLEALRDAVIDGCILPIANLHLRLLGLPLKAKATVERIQTSDALADAKTHAQNLENAEKSVAMGFQTADEACKGVTGHTLPELSPEDEAARQRIVELTAMRSRLERSKAQADEEPEQQTVKA